MLRPKHSKAYILYIHPLKDKEIICTNRRHHHAENERPSPVTECCHQHWCNSIIVSEQIRDMPRILLRQSRRWPTLRGFVFMSDECVWKQRLLARVKTLWREKRKSFYGELKRNTRHSMFYQLLFCDGISWCVVFGQFSPPLIPWKKNSPSLAGIPLVFCFDEHPLNFMTFIFWGTWTTVDRWSFSLMSFTINLSELTSKEQRVIYSLLPLWLK